MPKIPLGKAAEVPSGKGKTFVTLGKKILVVSVGGAFKAYENFCPHMGGALRCGGEKNLTCDWHGAQFDVQTGEAILGAEGTRLKPMTVVEENGDLYWMREEEKSAWADDFS